MSDLFITPDSRRSKLGGRGSLNSFSTTALLFPLQDSQGSYESYLILFILVGLGSNMPPQFWHVLLSQTRLSGLCEWKSA